MGVLSNIRFAVQRLRGKSQQCVHKDRIRDVTPNSGGCEQCIALGEAWVHLRMCVTCGQVGCCDSSKNKHASKHAGKVDHPIACSAQPGEDWMWCYVDETLVENPR